ncbi:MAG: hypothetical protein D8M61_13385 [Ignavibacteriae bacterium]|nr:hypothetical protein [Ignavibacteriota bacterium]
MKSYRNYKQLFYIGLILEISGSLLLTIFKENNNSSGVVFIAVGSKFFIINLKNINIWNKQ